MLLEGIPEDIEDDFNRLRTPDVQIASIRRSGGPNAGVELYLPAAVALFIASSYFGGALKKAGEDHYAALKRVGARLWTRASGLKITVLGSAGKHADEQKFSLAFAITGDVAPGLRFKLILRLNAGEAEAEDAVSAFLDTVRAIIEDRIEEAELAALLTYKPIGGTALVTFDPVEKRIVPVNGMARS